MPAPDSRKARSRWISAFTGLAFTVLLVGLLEFVGWMNVHRPLDSYVPSWRFHHHRKPDSTLGPKEYFAWNAQMARYFPESARWRFNGQGWLRESDVETRKPPGVYRIFYLGDSFTEGHTLQSESLPHLVEQRLQSLFPEEVGRWEAVNTGVPGYSPTAYYLLLRYQLAEYDPDLVVVNIDMTDDFDEWKARQQAIVDDEGNPVALPFIESYMAAYMDTNAGAMRATPVTRALLYLHRHSYFFSYLQFIVAAMGSPVHERDPNRDDVVLPRWRWCDEEWDAAARQNVDATFDMIRRIAELCRRLGVRLMLSSVPYYEQYHPDGPVITPCFSDRPHRELAQLSREIGVPFLNTFEALREAVEGSPREQYYYPTDIHFNGEGNRLWAEAQVEMFLQQEYGLLPQETLKAALEVSGASDDHDF